MGNATGCFNMLRNIGGSIGISMAHHPRLFGVLLCTRMKSARTFSAKRSLQQRSRPLAHYLAHSVGPAQARRGAFGMLYGLMEQQSASHGVWDVFRWTGTAGVLLPQLPPGCSRSQKGNTARRRWSLNQASHANLTTIRYPRRATQGERLQALVANLQRFNRHFAAVGGHTGPDQRQATSS